MPDGGAKGVTSSARWAVYVAPPTRHRLWQLGNRWLGRNPETDEHYDPPSGVDTAHWETLVTRPAHYGFHATLRPPMPLRPDLDIRALRSAVRQVANNHAAFKLPALEITRLDRFYALSPVTESPRLDALAADIVRCLDDLRDPDAPARAQAGLTPRQQTLNRRWGYPFVFDEYRFHMTLTAPVDETSAASVAAMLEQHFRSDVLAAPLPIDALALYYQPNRATPFRLVERIALANPDQ